MKGCGPMPLLSKKTYTIDDIYSLPDGQRAELVDGTMYNMAPPSRIHQKLVMEISAAIRDYIKSNGGSCEVYPAPFAVFLSADNKNYIEPDISVICNPDRLTDKGCTGAPDWIIEIASPSSQRMDYLIKLLKYRTAGVKEYWIVNPDTQTATVYEFENNASGQYTFSQNIPCGTFDGLNICISDLLG